MHIWLARHGDAVNIEESGSEFERRLSERGRTEMTQIGRWLQSRERHPDLILHSPLKRACETAEILRQELDAEIPMQVEPLLGFGMRCEQLLAKLARRTEAVILCVGHQPDVARCLHEMLGGGQFAIAPGTIACIDFPQVIQPGGGQLRWMIDPAWFE